MRRLLTLGLLVAGMGLTNSEFANAADKNVLVIPDEPHQRVDITIDGKPFTSYVWPTSLKKPVLYPLIDDEGITVTRGYPLEPRPGERVDHPHHAGMWFNYGNVNGYDFWNNSDAIEPKNRPKMGTITQKKIVSVKSGVDRGELVVESLWVTGEGKEILKDTTRYIFIKRKDARVIDQIITLKALDNAVFNDDKEGLLGIRVAHWLESADEKGGIFMDASGRPTKVDSADSKDSTGVYLTSEGTKGGAVWSTRGSWCILTGNDPGKHVATIGVIDNTGNPGYPTYWHARGYGLFAANPLGRSIFDPKQTAFKFTIQKDQTATFRYRVILFSRTTTPEEMSREADAFATESK